MTRTRGLLVTTAAIVLLVFGTPDLRAQTQRIEEPLPTAVTDLDQAQLIEIRNDAGVSVLKGTFEARSGSNERKAKLSGISGRGSAEIEVSKKDGQVKNQELEVELDRLLYSAPYKIFVDNKEVFAFSADDKGKAIVKLSSKITKCRNAGQEGLPSYFAVCSRPPKNCACRVTTHGRCLIDFDVYFESRYSRRAAANVFKLGEAPVVP